MKTFAASVFIFLFFNISSFSQEFSIDGGDIFQCGVWLVDDGLSGNYSTNRMDTISICTESPDTIVNLYFSEFDLGLGDLMMVYNGNSTDAQLLGIYEYQDLLEQHISSTNASGCLTLVFISDSTFTGDFKAYISCGALCAFPLVGIISEEESPVLLCPGEEIIFDGSATLFSDQSGIHSFLWEFGDGTNDSVNWPLVSHIFNDPGVYQVGLNVSDSLGCSNNYADIFWVKVSTYPDFSLLTEDFITCAPGQYYLGVSSDISDSLISNANLNNWISNTILGNSNADFNDPVFIPDNQSECLYDSITYSYFPNDAFVQSVDDIGNIWINIEHSYLGDLVIGLTCPNGNSILLHSQDVGGTFLGEPVDDESSDIGIGYDYFWTQDTSNATWAEVGWGLETLPSGDYQSVESMDLLVGCPLNGTWIITICDMGASDNGYLFSWGVNFNPPYISDTLVVSPVYGANCDSSYWTGSDIVDQTSGCDFILADITQEGLHEFVYTVVNDYGCSFDTTVSVQLELSTPVFAGNDLIYECQPLLLEGAIQGANAGCSESNGFYSHCFGEFQQWDITYCPDNIGNGSMMSIALMSAEFLDGYTTFTVYNGASTSAPVLAQCDLDSEYHGTYTASNPAGCLTVKFHQNAFTSCQDGFLDSLTYYISCVAPDEVPYQFHWSPEIGLSNPNLAATLLNGIATDTTYILQGSPIGHPECTTADTISVDVTCLLQNVAEHFQELSLVKTTFANNEIFIQFNHRFEGEISLFDLSGREISKFNCRATETSMDCSTLADGCYLIHFNSPKYGLYSRKIIITR
jgi:subtilisin-like proprotein convertase family protein